MMWIEHMIVEDECPEAFNFLQRSPEEVIKNKRVLNISPCQVNIRWRAHQERSPRTMTAQLLERLELSVSVVH